uniref:hypothetical protein n=1 Tax=Amycolatopsis sp. CA-151526 TaxID=3239921 RepID=UPI003F49A87D
MAAARWAASDSYASAARVEWEGFCLLHHLIVRTGASRSARRFAQPVPEGWREISFKLGCPWVVIDTRPDGSRLVRQLSEDEFTAEFEPTEQAWEDRRDAQLAWARHQLDRFGVDAHYLCSNSGDLDRPPWNDPVLRAERERVTALVTESGRPYDETFDPEQPDRVLNAPASPSAFRVTRDVAAVLRVLLDRPDEQISGEEITQRSELGWKASRTLWRLKEAGWVETHRDGPPGPAAEHRWSLTETGARLARERLTGRTKRTGA